jgi:uncharacterized protein (TIRG00374 family)
MHELSKAQIIAFILILIFIGSFIIIVLWGNAHRVQLISVVSKVSISWENLKRKPHTSKSSETVQRLFDSFDRLKDDGWKRPALSSALSIGFDIMTLYLIFQAAGYKVSIGILLAGYGLPILFGKMAFLIPGGVGIVEGSMAHFMRHGSSSPHHSSGYIDLSHCIFLDTQYSGISSGFLSTTVVAANKKE